MTNNELAIELIQRFRHGVEVEGQAPNWEAWTKMLFLAFSQARDEEHEAACKALCEGCRAGAPFEQPMWPRYAHIFPTPASRFECGAHAVRSARVTREGA